LVTEGETIKVELIASDDKQVTFKPLLLIAGETVSIGRPTLDDVVVTAEVLESDKQAEKYYSYSVTKPKNEYIRCMDIVSTKQYLKITKIAE